MRLSLLDLIVCAGCDAETLRATSLGTDQNPELSHGVVWCASCMAWYPVEDGLLELLPESLMYVEDRERFWSANQERLQALGLQAPRADVDKTSVHEQRHQQEHFDWYADNPQQTYERYERLPFWQAADSVAFGPWRREIRPGSRVLDVGCAQGRSTYKLMDLDIEVAAFDVSKSLVRQALDRYKRKPWPAAASFFVADASRLPFRSGVFDVVLIYGVLHHLPDPAATCREVARVLTRDGVYFCSENNETLLRAPFELLQRLLPLWYEEAGEHAQISRRDLSRWFGAAGLEFTSRTSVFLPPHLLNRLPPKLGRRLIALTDRVTSKIPILRDAGGLIIARATKAS
jgi:ubiquinone/menaquinone biosynthesis C-methylase UbiE/uncharacterized protein YbaR (Trm112 family)